MTYIFLMGFLLGLRHALDADHIAAVATLATRTRSVAETVRVGLAWGAGHALMLFAVCLMVLALGTGVPETLAGVLEFAVGVMLVLLGADVVRRVMRERVHAHAHRHDDHGYHIHMHSHAGETHHDDAGHAHRHPTALSRRAALVGLMHGLAGSAALLLLSLGSGGDFWEGLAYVALFGVGSMLGMAALSLTIALPLSYGARFMTWGYNGIHAAVGAGTIVLGGLVMLETAGHLRAWLGLV